MSPPARGNTSVRVGVCGFCLPQGEVFRRFRLLETQQTFYWPPQLKTAKKWRATAPSDFEFTVKAFQAITHPGTSPTYRRTRLSTAQREQCGHFRDTQIVRDAWKTTAAIAAALESKIVVFQCPPKFDAREDHVTQLRWFFHWIERGTLRLAWEPRHVSWSVDLVTELCQELDLIHAVDPLEQASLFGTPRYYRLHGKSRGDFRYDYNHVYTDEQLQEILASCIRGPTYCVFNNIQMATDVERFERLLNANGTLRDSDKTPSPSGSRSEGALPRVELDSRNIL